MSDKSFEQHKFKESAEKIIDTDRELTTLALRVLKENTEMINDSHDALAKQLLKLNPEEQQSIVDTFASPDLAQQIKEEQDQSKKDGETYTLTKEDLKMCVSDFFTDYVEARLAKENSEQKDGVTPIGAKAKRNTLQLVMLFLLPLGYRDEFNSYANKLYHCIYVTKQKTKLDFNFNAGAVSKGEEGKTRQEDSYAAQKVSNEYYNDKGGPKSYTKKVKVGDFSYDNVMKVAKQYDGKPYVWGGAGRKTRGVDCSGMRCAVLGDLAGKPFPRHTALSFYNKSQKISLSPQTLQSKITPGTFMFRQDAKGGRRRHSSIYHIEMVTSSPYQKDGLRYVKTYGSSSDRLPNGKKGVGERERKIEDPDINTNSRTDMKHLFGTIV